MFTKKGKKPIHLVTVHVAMVTGVGNSTVTDGSVLTLYILIL